jgi:hypothetical protein
VQSIGKLFHAEDIARTTHYLSMDSYVLQNVFGIMLNRRHIILR